MHDYFTIQFLGYLLRWVVSAMVMFVPLWLLVKFECCSRSNYSEYIHLTIVQIIGAFIFFRIDKLIFSN